MQPQKSLQYTGKSNVALSGKRSGLSFGSLASATMPQSD
jgi:hypothetical protein